ncbi:MAG: hypothetical protein K2O45_15670 [Oscillospiraceae bacterium]|nr:hypothetical protein [Oscillospiraceae bacterium]
MNIGTIFGNYSPNTAGRTAAARSTQGRNSFNKDVNDLTTNRTKAYGKSSRPKLTDSEVRELGQKYDFRNMTQESYDAFLGDLVQKGVLTRGETGYFGYGGEVRKEAADSGLLVMSIKGLDARYTQNTPFLEDGASGSGNMVAWLAQMMTECEGGDGTQEGAKRAQQRMEMYGALIDVVYRATDTSVEDTLRARYDKFAVTADHADSVIDQIVDPNSAFYENMLQRMRLQLEQSEEDKKEQAIIDALGAILDGMRSTDGVTKKKDMVSSVAGLSKQISELDEEDPRRAQLDLFRQRLNQLGIFVDLDLGVKGGKDKDENWQTLTQYLTSKENKDIDPSIFDLI